MLQKGGAVWSLLMLQQGGAVLSLLVLQQSGALWTLLVLQEGGDLWSFLVLQQAKHSNCGALWSATGWSFLKCNCSSMHKGFVCDNA